MTTWTMNERRAWVSTYLASGLSQAEFCRAHRDEGAPSERSLRVWLAADRAMPVEARDLHAALVRLARALVVATAEVQRVLRAHEQGDALGQTAASGSLQVEALGNVEGTAAPNLREQPAVIEVDAPAPPALEPTMERAPDGVEPPGLRLPAEAAVPVMASARAEGPRRKRGFFHDME